jgi:ADP-heptose:LPS heptosyltransferase
VHQEQLLYFLNSITSKCFKWLPRKKRAIKNILVVKLDEIGDMVYAIPIFDLLKQQFPEATLTVLCKPAAAQLLINQNSIDHIVHHIDNQKVDIWIELRGTYSTWLKSIKAFPLARFDRGTVRFKNKLMGGQLHEIRTNLQVIKQLFAASQYMSIQLNTQPFIYTNSKNDFFVKQLIEKNNLDHFYLFHTGASVPERRWPIERFAQLAHKIYDNLGKYLVIIGGPDETVFIASQLHLFPASTLSIVGKATLTDIAILAKNADFFIGNESGPIHIVSTAKIPTIGLYGPGVKDVFYPLGNKVKIIHHFLDKGHTKQTVGNSTINQISVEEVWNELNKLIL